MTKMTHGVLVTGAAGFVGSHLLDLLYQHNESAVAWCRPHGAEPPQNKQLLTQNNPSIEWKSIDLLNREAVEHAIAELRPEIVYHCAGAPHVGQSWKNVHQTLQSNVQGTHNLLEALRKSDVRARILIPGTALVYQQSQEAMTEEHPLKPLDPYAVSKLAQEQVGLCFANEGSGSVIVTRSFNHIGPRQAPVFALSGFARRIAEIEAGQAEPIIFAGNLSAKRDITDVRDTVRAYYVLMQQGVTGRIYNVCSGNTWSIKELLDHLLEKASVPITVKIKGDRLRPNDAAVLLGNPNRIRNELGWKPEISIKNTMHDLLTYWRGVMR